MTVISVALVSCSPEDLVLYEDEVDIYLNPEIGADWQVRGQQKRVVMPGQNEKYYLAGDYRWSKIIMLIEDNCIIH